MAIGESMKKVAIGHPTMGYGGSEARAMWLLQTLKDKFNVTLVTTRNVNLNDLNQFYGTSVGVDEVSIRIIPVPFFMKNSSGIAALRGAFYSRFTKRIGREYDLCISSYNLADWGVPALHFIADFVWDRELANQFDPMPEKGAKYIHKANLLRKIYLAVCGGVGGPLRSQKTFFDGSETIISNSLWSAGIIKDKYGYVCDGNVYPAVQSEFRGVPRGEKTFSFVSIGRVAQEKRIEQQIEILEKVRELGHVLQFHLIGGVGNDPYGRFIRSLCEGKEWITLHGRKSGADKDALLTESKFAIHTRPHEAFGITVAEMLQAGCIPFIPDSGGQTEIVPLKELQFASVDDAVHKIVAVLRDENLQQRILHGLAPQKSKFSTEQFCGQIRQIVDDWFRASGQLDGDISVQ
ncbi:glycosyltransferase family 4 protein [Desulfobulbus rhabdoformis]|uniref:glycosyltransferase family 4 protein n=1 Tax=Desulfobulbus rhabdoformis TaxID=34032 RepID=UPI001965C30D|nr:glycosyltransferase family 4 protein [Desulfobulbus rhabdoformis]MBM9612698.1 glycosyltransferase family 4 protein [Desulfobulbus rhabdoformis]